ncbi:MAG TPA: AsmA-like C-terminal region-containing protein [Chitinophagaceae bacterium]
MKKRVIRGIKKTAKITGITIGSLLLLMFLLPYILPGTISRKIKTLVNRSIDGKVEFSKARLSFFNHFPSLTLTLYDFTSTGSAPYQDANLLAAGEVAFGIDIPDLIGGDITINEFFITEATINVQVNEKGEANYNVYKSSSKKTDTSASSPDTTTALRIEKIVIENSKLVYDDLSSAVFIDAKGLNYAGNGDLSKAVFDLASHITIDSFDFYYDREPYVLRKSINADLVTSVNTNSLALEFTKNELKINRLPLEFTGRFEFLESGYFMNFNLNSNEAELADVFTALPPSYQGWLKKTKIKGNAAIIAELSGRYIGGTDTMPDLSFDMKIREGYIAYDKAIFPVSNLYLDFESRLPSLNTDSLSINIDSAFFNLEKNHFSSVLKVKGLEAPYILANISSEMDLEKFDRALGLQDYDLKGKLDLRLQANGRYATGQNPDRIRNETVITSIPSFNLQSRLQNGYLHFTSLPQPIQQINFNLNAGCPDNDYHHTSVAVENIDIKVLNNYIKGFIRLKNADNFPVDADLDAIFNLSDIQQFYPLDSMDINGDLVMRIKSTGNYQPAENIFPKTEAILKVENASVKTKYYPAPIEKIAVDAAIQNKEGTLNDLKVDVQPISFVFEGKSFTVKAALQDFDNLQYDIVSKGEVDLGKIYKVFAQEGLDVQGSIETDLALKGNQADAAAGRYSRLHNSGTLKVNNLTIFSDLYPHPFYIDRGAFRFYQDQMKIEQFRTKYGKSVFTLNGFFSNIFDYVADSGPLKGDLRLQSDYILLDELMAYNADNGSAKPDSLASGSSGVIMVPGDLDLKFTADVKTVEYNKLQIKSVKGEVLIKGAELKVNETGFVLADAVTTMNASYKSLSPARAWFSYDIKAENFDVKKMYNQLELFRELAPAAASAEGIISLDYALEGKLGGDMYPIMPSLKGGGVLSVEKVKMKGFKLFSAMSKETGKEKIKDPDLSKIKFKTTIKNNVVTLEKTKIKVAGFRIKIQGQTNFNGQIKFDCRIGLPPFGIFGIPVKATGSGQNPKIKVGKSDKLPLEEEQEEMMDTVQ